MRTNSIIVTWNQTELTMRCLDSLVAAGVAPETIWVVDNGSQPSAIPALGERFPAINLVRSERNLGFAGGCNLGAASAAQGAAAAEQLFFLNNDALVEPDTLERLLAALAADPGLAAVSPKVYYGDSDRVIHSTGMTVEVNSGMVRMLHANQPDRGQADRPADREALFGCAMLIRRAVWDSVGPFWAPFFAYSEEVDWCLRARRAGWRLGYVPAAVVWHYASTSLGHNSPLKLYLLNRNQLYLRQRHRGRGWPAWRGGLRVLAMQARTAGHFARQRRWRQAWAIVLAVWDFVCRRTGQFRRGDLRRIDKGTP
ncbi:MAG TPA: glycosyltransferase family 2 protein [Herpetosiphonaceae bacterium]|nr:glycosyltransferase family 2 protein [Herpetosiphonaceae bacterium]